MSGAEASPFVLIGGLALVYLALLLTVIVVLKSRRTINIQRRRPQEQERGSILAVLTNSTKDVIDSKLGPNQKKFLSQSVLDAAGLKKQASDYLLIAAVLILIAVVLGLVLGGLMPALLFGLISGAGLWGVLRLLTSKRQAKFDDQVTDTLQLLTGGMRAGHSLLRAIDAAAAESDVPMSEELSRIVNETRIGRDLGSAMIDVSTRTQNEDFAWIAQAIEIHREVGGDLAEVLDHVSETIRDRNQVKRQAKALSAEGRMSALVLLALPVVMFLALNLVNPTYAHTFTSTLPGYLMIAASIVLLGFGSFWLSRLIKPKY